MDMGLSGLVASWSMHIERFGECSLGEFRLASWSVILVMYLLV